MFDSFQDARTHWFHLGFTHSAMSRKDRDYFYSLQPWEQAELDAAYEEGYEA